MTAPPANSGTVAAATVVDLAAQAAYYARQQLARRTVLAVRELWAQLDPAHIRASWRQHIGPAVLDKLTAAQEQAAAAAGPTVEQLLSAQGINATATVRIVPAAFAGVASDGRDLASLLELSNLYALKQIGAGIDVGPALASSGNWLELVTGLQVVDAGRVADGVALTTHDDVQGYVRMLTLPSCSRCIVLAGKFYRWNAGFLRHPRCDCRHVPASEDQFDDLRTDPRAAFESMTTAEQDTAFTKAGAQAIRDGADIGKVVNARDGMYTASGRQLTHAGIKHRHSNIRLMPEQIYRDARGDRDLALRLLRRFGYITRPA